MRLIWSSSDPSCATAYGIISNECIMRLKDAGHYVRCATKHTAYGFRYWRNNKRIAEYLDGLRAAFQDYAEDPNTEAEVIVQSFMEDLREEIEGIEVMDGINVAHVNKMAEQEKFDYVFTSWDIWTLNGHRMFTKDKWIAHIPIDTEWISRVLSEVAREPGIVAAMSKHGMRELESIGLKPFYLPLGIHTDIFKIKPDGRERFRSAVHLKGNEFVVGSVGLNYSDDRKGFIPLMMAFKEFHKRHDEARLYIHTHAGGIYPDTIDYLRIAKNLGIADFMLWPDQAAYDLSRIDAEMLADIYNGMDMFCLATRGEGFGIPIVEAQACGKIVAVSNTTSGPELCKTGVLIETNEMNDREYISTETWRLDCTPGAVLDALEDGYERCKTSDKDELARTASNGVAAYSWDYIWPKYWEPFWKVMEDRINGRNGS